MSITFDANNKMKPGGAPGKTQSAGAERRRRRRVKISGHVHVKTRDCASAFEEVCKSVDVSRDGVLFTTARAGYWKGQILDVTFPYSSADTLSQPQGAEVVRVDILPGRTYGIAVQFHKAKETARTSTAGAKLDPYVAGPGERPRTEAKQSKSRSVVLAVEADATRADMIRNVLQPDGYTVVVVEHAEAALEVLRTTVPSVFIGEAQGEGMSGLDLCVMIKGNDRLKGVPVILVTRAGDATDYSASEEMGAVVCVAKDLLAHKLQQVVRLVAPPPAKTAAYGASIYSGAIQRVF